MPQKIQLADGTEREIPTDEELKAYQAAQAAVEVEKKAREEAELRAKTAEEGTNPNWADVRKQLAEKKRLEDQIKAQGKQIDAQGNIIDTAPPMSVEDVKKEAAAAATQAVLNAHLESQLSKYTQQERDAMKYYYDKFAAGETLDVGKIDRFLNDARNIVKPQSTGQPGYMNLSGQPPRPNANNDLSADAVEFANLMGNNPEDLAKVDEPLIKLR